jgi:hypothetical protein
MAAHVVDVGPPDPELQTSPILDASEEPTLDADLEAGACYFNNVAYRVGQYVRSGSELLHCEERGVWVRKDEVRTDEIGGRS